MAVKKRWTHNQQCDYCKSQSYPPVVFQVKGLPTVSGCKHFRGGKTRAKNAR